MKQVKAIIKPYMASKVIKALKENVNFPDVVVSSVVVFGKPREMSSKIKIYKGYFGYAKRVKLEFFIADDHLDQVLDIISNSAYTGNPYDGKILVSNVDEVIKIQIGEKEEDVI